MLVLLEWSAAFITWFLVRTQPFCRRIEPFVRLVFFVVISLIVTFWISVFCYLSIYYLYVPAVELIVPLHLKFSSLCKLDGSHSGTACSFLNDNVSLAKHDNQPFAFGQSYKVFVELEMPESQVNVDIGNKNIGMFMIGSDFYTKDGTIVQSSERSVMLEYRSDLLKLIDTLVFAPFYLLRSKRQTQILQQEMLEDFHNNPYSPIKGCLISLKSPLVQVYSGRIQFYAKFSGLRWLMFYHPMLAAFIGVTCFFLSFNFVILITLIRRQWIRVEYRNSQRTEYRNTRQRKDDLDDWITNPEVEMKVENENPPDDGDDNWPEPRPVIETVGPNNQDNDEDLNLGVRHRHAEPMNQ